MEINMRIIQENQKKGIIELIPETLDDLWHLSHIIEKGDLLSSQTTRRIQDTSGEKIRSDRGIKKTFYLGIRVETVKFHRYTGKLRATGTIEKGPEDLIPLGSHHTLEIKLNTPLKIKKETWSKWALRRLKDAIKSSKRLYAIILAIEDDTAEIGLIRQYGIDYYGPIIGNIPGKRIQTKDRRKKVIQFYEKIIEAIKNLKEIELIVIAGPGFTKTDFHSYLKEKHPKLAKISIIESTGTGGRVGIQEVLRKGTIEKAATENRIAKETRAVNEILEEIAKSSDLIAYGKKEVTEAANMGAIKKLLILDKLVNETEKLLDLVENTGGQIILISSEHEGGKQLESLGGIAATLRFKIH